MKSKYCIMMRGNVIVAAFVAVLLFHSHYNQDGVGMVAAAAASGGGGEEEAATTTRGTMMMTKTVVDEVPVPTRKLIKNSKAFKPDANKDVMESLLRLLVFAKVIDVYRSTQPPPSSEESTVLVRRTRMVDLGLEPGEDGYNEYACDGCVAFYKWVQEEVPAQKQADFCEFVVGLIQLPFENDEFLATIVWLRNYCLDLLGCPSSQNSTPTTCCQSQDLCQDPAYYCKLNSDSGSTENYWIQTETKAVCDTRSMAIGCGACKDEDPGNAILEKAGMPTDGFVSYCRGGPCVWTTQKTQCMGLTAYPALTTPEACKDACCNDYTCAVWQFDAEGHKDQCWYGTNCDITGEFLAWTYGGIRKIGTDQAPDCAYYCKLNKDSGSTENYWIQTETKEGCDTESTAIGCGTCKDEGTSDTILEQAGMPTNGFSFVSYCQGGPCVWTTQKTQCMGLKKYPNIKTSSACKAACCGDYTCAVWQFDADGYKDQCWYGTNCDEFGDLTWTSGGIREMGTDQAPDCVRPDNKVEMSNPITHIGRRNDH